MNRIGRFVIKSKYINPNNQALYDFMSRFIVVRAELRYDLDGIEYMVVSKYLPEVGGSVTVPTYGVRYFVNGWTNELSLLDLILDSDKDEIKTLE